MRTPVLASFLVGIALAGSAYGIHWDIVQPHSPAKSLSLPEISFAIGCELRGCCAGCPLTLPIDLQVHVDESITRQVALRIDNLDADDLGALKVSGNARIEGTTIVALPGESTISGFPDAPGRPPVLLFVQPAIDEAKWIAIGKASRATARGGEGLNYGAGAGTVEIVQLRGGTHVNYFRYRYPTVDFVPAVAPGPDEIRLAGNESGDNAIVMTDFRSGSGCECDSIFRTTATAVIGNARRKCLCNSEISVFARENAMSYDTDVRAWHRRSGETYTVQLQPVIRVPVNVVVSQPGVALRALQDIGNANTLFNRNRVGVLLEPKVTDLSGSALGEQLDRRLSCSELEELRSTGLYRQGQMNVYYHVRPDGARTCSDPEFGDLNVIFVGTAATLVSLTHEIGHSYGLLPLKGGHVNCVAGFGNDNIMWPEGPPTRWSFTLGQVFRLNVRDTSQLNVNGLRHGPTRTCAPLAIDLNCPILTLDAAP